jgi:hypothetical protein
MADYELVEERLISGKGVLRVPQQERPIRHYILYLDVIREPSQKYLNLNYNPGRSRFATCVFERNAYVQSISAMEYPKQLFENVNDITGQNLIAIKCAYQGILETFVNLALAIPVIFPTTLENSIKDYESLDLFWDAVKIVCYADTAIQARLFKLEYDRCQSDFDKKKRPPPPPPPLPPVPPGTAIADISPPYDGDGDDTDPHPIDDEPPSPYPAGNECQAMRVTVRYTQVSNGQVLTRAQNFWGEIRGIRFRQKTTSPPEQFIEVESRGLVAAGACKPAYEWARLNSAGGTDVWSNLELISILPV